jgi:hypothetical protein
MWDSAPSEFIPLAMDTTANTPNRDRTDSGVVECWDDDDASQPVGAVIPHCGPSTTELPSHTTTSTGSGRAWIPRRVEMDMEVDAAVAALNSVVLLGLISESDYAHMSDALSRCRLSYMVHRRSRSFWGDDDSSEDDEDTVDTDLLLDNPDDLFAEGRLSALETACLLLLQRRHRDTTPPQELGDGDIGWLLPNYSLSRDIQPLLHAWGLQ